MTYETLKNEEEETSLGSNAKLTQPKIMDYFSTVPVKVSKISVLKGLLTMVTKDGRPFTALEDNGFTIAFGSILRHLHLNYNRHNISELIGAAANYIIAKLTKILKQKTSMVSVKVDAASRFSRSFLGVNVQVST